MDEETQPTEVEQKPKSVKKFHKKTLLLYMIIIVLMGASAGAAYWWRDADAKDFQKKQASEISSLLQTKTSLEKQLAEANAKITVNTDEQTTCVAKSPTTSVIENIKASITSGNTAALEGYMASSVNVILAASDGIGERTTAQSVGDITSFIGDSVSTSWDFDLDASTLNAYSGGGYSQYFAKSSVVGKSDGNKVISFSFDCNAKISTVFLASNDELLN